MAPSLSLLSSALALLVLTGAVASTLPRSYFPSATFLSRSSTIPPLSPELLLSAGATGASFCSSSHDSNLTSCPIFAESTPDFCSTSAYGNLTSGFLPPQPASEEVCSAGDVPSENVGDLEQYTETWVTFATNMKEYAKDAAELLASTTNHAYAWADLAKEWSFHTSSVYPYNALLLSSPSAVDRYTEDVSLYAGALASFAEGFGVVVEEAAASIKHLEEQVLAIQPEATAWHNDEAVELLQYAIKVSDELAYLSEYATDLKDYVEVWYENVAFLEPKDVNATARPFDVQDKAEYLDRYAQDVAQTTADWADSAAETLKWAQGWVDFGTQME